MRGNPATDDILTNIGAAGPAKVQSNYSKLLARHSSCMATDEPTEYEIQRLMQLGHQS